MVSGGWRVVCGGLAGGGVRVTIASGECWVGLVR